MITVETFAAPTVGTDTAAFRRLRHKTDDLYWLLDTWPICSRSGGRANATGVLGYAAIR